VPERLRRHEFKKLLPEGLELPPPLLDHWDREACKAFNYPGYSAWLAEDVAVRGMCIAHEMAKSQRAAYYSDVMSRQGKSAGNETTPTVAPWDVVHAMMFRPAMPR